jgi:hypothetical protein
MPRRNGLWLLRQSRRADYFIRSNVFSGASVIRYQLFVIYYLLFGEAGGDAAEERLRLLVCRKERAPLLDGKAEGRKTKRENRPLLFAGNAVRGEPVAHRGVFGRRGRAPFGEFLALFRQQFH